MEHEPRGDFRMHKYGRVSGAGGMRTRVETCRIYIFFYDRRHGRLDAPHNDLV